MTDYPFDLVLYDFDGTLVDSVPVILSSFKAAYVKVFGRCERTDEDLRSFIGLPLGETFKSHDPETADRLLKAYLEDNEKKLVSGELKFFPGIWEMLNEIKKAGVKQGVVSSKRRHSAGITMDNLGILDFFDVCIFKEDTVKHKPEGEPISEAARRMGVFEMNRVLYVGDAAGDIQCANNAEAKSAFVGWSLMDKNEIMAFSPTFCPNTPKALSCIILKREL